MRTTVVVLRKELHMVMNSIKLTGSQETAATPLTKSEQFLVEWDCIKSFYLATYDLKKGQLKQVRLIDKAVKKAAKEIK